MNKCMFTGRMTRDPELRRTNSGTSVCEAAIAVDDGWGENKKTFFPTIILWRHNAEYIAKYGHKGDLIEVSARFTERKWTDRDGHNRISVEFVADEVHILSAAKRGGGVDTPAGRYAPQESAQGAWGGFAPEDYTDIRDPEEGELPF